MNRKVNFSKIKQCNQIWEKMESCNGGRKCTKCSHIITDFRGMSDWEIAVAHANSESKICGLYDKEILHPTERSLFSTRLRNLAIPAIIGILFTGNDSFAQSTRVEPQVQVESIDNTRTIRDTKDRLVNNSTDTLKIIEGILTDESHDPIVGGNIIIKGTSTGTVTDIDGSFTLDVTSAFINNSEITLIATYLGYGEQQIEINENDFTDEMKYKMHPIAITEQNMMISFGIKQQSLPKRVWRGIVNVFRKKK